MILEKLKAFFYGVNSRQTYTKKGHTTRPDFKIMRGNVNEKATNKTNFSANGFGYQTILLTPRNDHVRMLSLYPMFVYYIVNVSVVVEDETSVEMLLLAFFVVVLV